MTLQQALKDIHFFRGVAPVKAYDVLTKHQEEVTPQLLQILKDAIQRHGRTGDFYVAHIHALLLLGQFEEKKAYPLIIELLNLPIESIDLLIGDMLTETIPKIVANVYDGNPGPLYAILGNKDANHFVRMVVGTCLTALIYQKKIDSKIVTLRLQEMIASAKMNEDVSFFTSISLPVMNCRLEPLYDGIRAAFKLGLIDKELMGLSDFNNEIKSKTELNLHHEIQPFSTAVNEIEEWGNYDGNEIAITIGPNELCPCGSGKEFKNCCISML